MTSYWRRWWKKSKHSCWRR